MTPSPKKRKLTENGEFQDGQVWFERNGLELTLGLTNRGLEKLGDADSIDLPNEGQEVKKGQLIVSLEGTHGTLEIVCPFAGVIREVNEAVSHDLALLNEDPLEGGWLVRLEAENLSVFENG